MLWFLRMQRKKRRKMEIDCPHSCLQELHRVCPVFVCCNVLWKRIETHRSNLVSSKFSTFSPEAAVAVYVASSHRVPCPISPICLSMPTNVRRMLASRGRCVDHASDPAVRDAHAFKLTSPDQEVVSSPAAGRPDARMQSSSSTLQQEKRKPSSNSCCPIIRPL